MTSRNPPGVGRGTAAPERFSWAAILLSTWLALAPCTATAAPARNQNPSPRRTHHADESIRQAVGLLGVLPPVPIEVVETRRLSRVLRNSIKRTCAYVHTGVARIYVVASCPVYQGAATSRFEAMKLAAILRHEIAHLEGDDEVHARVREAKAFRDLLDRAPAHLLAPGVVYAVALSGARQHAAVPHRTPASIPLERTHHDYRQAVPRMTRSLQPRSTRKSPWGSVYSVAHLVVAAADVGPTAAVRHVIPRQP